MEHEKLDTRWDVSRFGYFWAIGLSFLVTVALFPAQAYAQRTPQDSARTLEQVGQRHAALATRVGLEEAIRYWMNSADLFDRVPAPREKQRVLNRIANAWAELNQYETALRYYHSALTISRQLGDRASEVKIMNNIATTYLDANQPDSAARIAYRTQEVAAALGSLIDQAHSENILGRAFDLLGQADSALAHFRKAIRLAREGNDPDLYGILNAAGMVHDRLGRADSALAAFREALDVFPADGAPAYRANLLMNIGLVLMTGGQSDSAGACQGE